VFLTEGKRFQKREEEGKKEKLGVTRGEEICGKGKKFARLEKKRNAIVGGGTSEENR